MSSVYVHSLVILLFTSVYLSQGRNTPNSELKEKLSDNCLGCICEAVSGCNLTRGCEEDDCGMFRITRRYWIDAGRPVLQLDNPQDEEAFRRCVRDPECAASTVRGYMRLFINKDCNGDGRVDCMDYAAAHSYGGYNCAQPLDREYESTMHSCLAQVSNQNTQKRQ